MEVGLFLISYTIFISHKVGKQFYPRQKIHYSLRRKIDYHPRRERFSAKTD